jgi:hypothetical protein
MARYQFHVTIQGKGDSEAEAWEDAVNGFAADPGVPGDAPGDVELVEDEDDEQEIKYPNV